MQISRKDCRRLVLMIRAVVLLPYIQMILAQLEQFRDILFRHDMPLLEGDALLDVLDDDGDIVAENMTLGLGCIDQTHTFLLVSRSGRV